MPARGRECHIDPKKLKAAVRRLDEQVKKTQNDAKQLEDREHSYDELRGLLESLPEKVTHPVMVPFGPLAFFEGHLQHTNEVLVQLSSEWFALKTAKQACGTVERRKQRLKRDMDDVDKELKELQNRRRLAVAEGHASGVHLGDPIEQAGLDGDGILDIREPCEEDTNRAAQSGVPGATVTRDPDGYLDIREPEEGGGEDLADKEDQKANPSSSSASAPAVASSSSAADSGDALARLRELERLEAQDEMDDLDDLVDSYENTGMAPGAAVSEPSGRPPAAAASPSGSAPAPEIRSPADIFRLMSGADTGGVGGDSAAAAASRIVPGASPGAAAANTSQPSPQRQTLSEKAWGGEVREKLAQSLSSGSAGAPSEVTANAAPKRVSKFKSERQRLG